MNILVSAVILVVVAASLMGAAWLVKNGRRVFVAKPEKEGICFIGE